MPVVEEAQRASADSDNALPEKAFVWPTIANLERADNAVNNKTSIHSSDLPSTAESSG